MRHVVNSCKLPRNHLATVRADAEFYVWLVFTQEDGQLVRELVGPDSAAVRLCKVPAQGVGCTLEVTAELDTLTFITLAAVRPEIEELDTTPMEMPLGYLTPPTLQESMRRMIREEMSMAAEAEGQESFEDADDFDFPDEDEEFGKGYEITDMQYEQPLLEPEPVAGPAPATGVPTPAGELSAPASPPIDAPAAPALTQP